MLITSGYDFEGYHITDYLGLCSGECALGTGFLSSFGAGIADLLGTNSSLYESKLNEARKHAINNLISNAASLGANAIIAVDVDYTVFSADIVGVTANGTAVKITKRTKYKTYPTIELNIKNFNPDLPIKPSNLSISLVDGECYAAISVIDISSNSITAIACDIDFTTILNDEYHFENIAFYNFAETEKSKTSEPVPISIPSDKVKIIKSAHLVISKYCNLGDVITPVKNDVIWNDEAAPAENQSDTVSFKVQFLVNIKSMDSAKEIYDYCTDYNSSNNGVIPPELLESIKSCALKERLYGNMYDECIKQISQYME